MKILLDDGMQKGVATGIGSYTAYLSRALAALPDTEVTEEDFSCSGSRKKARFSYLSYLNSTAYRKKISGFDLVHYTNYAMPSRLPSGVASAVTVHDLTAFLHPDTLPRAYVLYNRFMIRRAAEKADVIFTVSDAVHAEFAARFPRTAQKTVTVYPGHYTGRTAQNPAGPYENPVLSGLTPGKFFLFVGTVEKRKNLVRLIEAYRLLVRRDPAAAGFSLVLAGRPGFGADACFRAAGNPLLSEDIRFPGYVGESDCARLYHAAAAFVFPSIYEGFGSPQTECMSCRLPLILSDIPTNREISGGYGMYFPPDDPVALADRMSRILHGEWDAAAADAMAVSRLARFDWACAAVQTRETYLRILL